MKDTGREYSSFEIITQNFADMDRINETVCDIADNAYLYYSFAKKKICLMGHWANLFPVEIHEFKDFFKIMDMVEEKYRTPLEEAIYPEKQDKTSSAIEFQLANSKMWLNLITKVYFDADRKPIDKIISISNVTKEHFRSSELTFLTYYDSVTGLYNRNYFIRLLDEYIRKASASGDKVSIMVIDIDEFKKVNDGLGMVAGDELVQQFGSFLKDICTENMIAGHLHTDVFCLGILNPQGESSPEKIYNKILQRTNESFVNTTGISMDITVSVGVADYPTAAQTPIELINCAEIILFRCKNEGKNMLQFFEHPVFSDFHQTIELENKLKKAITNNDFYMCYQPQYFADSRILRGVEALIRWQNTEEYISPATFIPVAEKNGSIIPIGKWVVEESIKQYAEWRKQFSMPFIMSINISALQYKTRDFENSIMEILKKYNVRPNEIELEITETVLIEDFDMISKKIISLREKGIRISLDDFGTGFSSLAYLKKLPADTLKLDKAFIDSVKTDESSKVIVESIVKMAKALGFESIAEGVEDVNQYDFLKEIGCDVIQGYYFGKPLMPKDVETILSGNA